MSSRGVKGAPPPSGSASHSVPARRAASATEVRAGYHKRLEDHMTRACDAFRDVVSACEIRDRATNARAELQSKVEVANLGKAADELLRLVSDLKVATIVQEIKETKSEANLIRTNFEKETRHSLYELTVLRDNVASTLAALEKHYYASTTRWSSKDLE